MAISKRFPITQQDGIGIGLRGKIGATVRLYGYPGTFKITDTCPDNSPYKWFVRPIRGDFENGSGFGVSDGSLVEVNGKRTALLSLPIAPPATDYPYKKTVVVPSAEERAYPLCRNVENDDRFLVLPRESTFYA